MAKNRVQQFTSARDVDLLLLIREEAAYADRIREALVFTESKLERAAAPVGDVAKTQYTRPLSTAERYEEEELVLVEMPRRSCKREHGDKAKSLSPLETAQPFVNPDIDRRRAVDDIDAVHSEASTARGRAEFTYDDLVATREGRKITTVRALRRLANLWDIDPKLNKEPMLSELIKEYARRYPDEVEAYERRRSSSRQGRPRRRVRRR